MHLYLFPELILTDPLLQTSFNTLLRLQEVMHYSVIVVGQDSLTQAENPNG